MKFKALKMALAAGFLMTASVVVGVITLEDRLVEGAGASAVARGAGTTD